MINLNDIVYKVGIYIRLSKEDLIKNEESLSVKNQKNILKKYVKDNNYELYNIYVDDGFTGTNFERPAFKKMISDIENKNINMVITKDLSRLGRDYIKIGELIEKYFPLHNIRYVSLLDGIDTFLDSSNNDIAPFKAIINDMYSKDNSKKIKAAMHAMQIKGKWVGGCVPLGYMKDPNDKNHLIINEEESKIVKTIFSLAKKGLGCYNIATELTNHNVPTLSIIRNINNSKIMASQGIWSSKTVKSILKNRVYIGDLIQNKNNRISYKIRKNIKTSEEKWIIVNNTHEPLVDTETFYYIQEILKKNNIKKNKIFIRLFDGLLYCKECKSKISILKPRKNNKTYIVCNKYRMYSKQKICTSHSFNYDDLEENILRQIKLEFIKKIDENKLINKINSYILKCNNKINDEYMNIKNNIEKKQSQLAYTYLDKLNGKINNDMYERIINIINKDINNMKEKEIKCLEKIKQDNINDYSVCLVRDLMKLKDVSRDIILKLVEKIEIDKNKNIYIYFNFC